jgi:hypothetical protein
MKELLASMEQSLKNENWYAALTIALILPDVCGKISYPEVHQSSARYATWFDKYVKKYYTIQENIGSASMYGGDCYAIRCAVLHEFSEDLSSHNVKKIIDKYKFCSPKSANNSYNLSLKESGNEIVIRIDEFCAKIRYGVYKWIDELGSDVEGLKPFVKID